MENTTMTYRITLFATFVGTVVAANWALNHYGLVPVGFGLEAPAGVYSAGLAFGLRDALHETGGRRWVFAAIATGAAVSYIVEDAVTIPGGLVPIAVASAAAFAVSELADLAVYTPLRERSWPTAVAASNIVGAVIDSALFLWLAFGALDHMAGQIVGKALMILPALLLMWGVRRAVPRYRLRPESA
jgi:uncharacterized PurR-regulated membrane protein YhhQ (DUF165 family)